MSPESAPVQGDASSGNGNDCNNSTECPTCGKDGFENHHGMKIHHKRIHGESLAHTVDCDWCGDTFERNPSVAKENNNNFCSNNCRGEWLSENNTGENSHCWVGYTTTECKTCESEFKHRPYIDRVFCDIDCRNDYEHGKESNFWSGGKETLECAECGNKFQVHSSHVEKRMHCSKECLNASREIKCDWCGDVFEVVKSRQDKARFCSLSCSASLRATLPPEKQPNWRGGHGGYDYGENWYSQRRKARKRDRYSCQVCGRDERQLGKIPSCHHIMKLRHYRDKYDAPEWYKKGNRLENLMLLCEQHHKDWEGIPLRPQVT